MATIGFTVLGLSIIGYGVLQILLSDQTVKHSDEDLEGFVSVNFEDRSQNSDFNYSFCDHDYWKDCWKQAFYYININSTSPTKGFTTGIPIMLNSTIVASSKIDVYDFGLVPVQNLPIYENQINHNDWFGDFSKDHGIPLLFSSQNTRNYEFGNEYCFVYDNYLYFFEGRNEYSSPWQVEYDEEYDEYFYDLNDEYLPNETAWATWQEMETLDDKIKVILEIEKHRVHGPSINFSENIEVKEEIHRLLNEEYYIEYPNNLSCFQIFYINQEVIFTQAGEFYYVFVFDPDSHEKTSIPRPKLAEFVDPDKDPWEYIERYDTEPLYKEWFDKNFPDITIFEAVGLEQLGKDRRLYTPEPPIGADATWFEQPPVQWAIKPSSKSFEWPRGDVILVKSSDKPVLKIFTNQELLQIKTNQALLKDIEEQQRSNLLIEGLSWIATGAIPLGFAMVMLDRFIWTSRKIR